MKSAIIVSVALAASIAGAHADYWDTTDYDLIRPHGRPRSEAVHQAAVAFCTKQTGENPNEADTSAFKRCLLGRGYRVQSEHLVHTPPAPTPTVTGGLNGAYVYDDASPGPLRSEKDVQAATRACERNGAVKIGAPAFNACMRARDWVFSKFEPTPKAPGF